MEISREYLNEPLVGIIAPAGYGKTEEIAEALKSCSGKQLILTHTRSGVKVLRERMKKKFVDKEKYEIETIASFCLKWYKAYPVNAKVDIPEKMSNEDYVDLYKGAQKIFSHKWAQNVLKQTYSGLFIDEYQDCTESQHELFMGLKELFPIRIFGDPMQGIFYWVKNDKIVNWNTFPFNVRPLLTVPRRWENTNKSLGYLISNIRNEIIVALNGSDVTININNVPGCITVLTSEMWGNGKYVYSIKKYDTVVYITASKNKQITFSQRNGGFFQCDEVKDMAETEKIIASIESNENEAKALALLNVLKDIINGLESELGSYIKNLSKGKSDFSKIKKHKDFGQLIETVCKDGTIRSIYEVLLWFRDKSNLKIYRRELFYRIEKTYFYMVSENISLREAIEILNGQQKFYERFKFSRLSSRTVLTKGLEFDCVIIDAKDKMDVRDFYVAMTRAKKHIYIISDAKQLSFKGVRY